MSQTIPAIVIDSLGDEKRRMSINDFIKLYNDKKPEFERLNTKFLNNHFEIVDDGGSEYKIRFNKGVLTLFKKTERDFLYKKDLVDEVKRLGSMQEEINFLNDRFQELDKSICELRTVLKTLKGTDAAQNSSGDNH